MKIRITEITEWEIDTHMIEGDISHMGGSYHREMAEAEEEMESRYEKGGESLPFETEAKDKYEAIDNYNEANYCYSYVKAVDCEWEYFNEETKGWEEGE